MQQTTNPTKNKHKTRTKTSKRGQRASKILRAIPFATHRVEGQPRARADAHHWRTGGAGVVMVAKTEKHMSSSSSVSRRPQLHVFSLPLCFTMRLPPWNLEGRATTSVPNASSSLGVSRWDLKCCSSGSSGVGACVPGGGIATRSRRYAHVEKVARSRRQIVESCA